VAVPCIARAAALRGFVLFGVWVVIGNTGLADLATGFVAAGLASWASLQLVPPIAGPRPRLLTLALLLLRLPWQAGRAGVDVARRALDPRMPVQPGALPFTSRLPGGLARDSFLALSSLQPGTVPVGEAMDGRQLIHALDTTQPVAGSMARDEAAFVRAVGRDG
jgi:multicomponent Na+:H+ antiporter subunit E